MVPPAAATLPPLPSWTRVPALLWIIPRRRLCCQPRLRLEIRLIGPRPGGSLSRRLWSVKSGRDDRATPPQRARSHSHSTRRSASPEGGRRNGDREVQLAPRRSAAHTRNLQRDYACRMVSSGKFDLLIPRAEAPVDGFQLGEAGGDRLGDDPRGNQTLIHSVEQAFPYGGEPRVAAQVDRLVRVVFEVEQPLKGSRQRTSRFQVISTLAAAGTDDQLEPVGADHCLLALVVLTEDHVSPFGPRLAFDQGSQVDALQGWWRRNVEQAADGREEIDELDHVGDVLALRQMTGPPHDQRHSDCRLIEAILLDAAVLPQQVADVAQEHDQGVRTHAAVLKCLDQAAGLEVHERERRVVSGLDPPEVVVGQVVKDPGLFLAITLRNRGDGELLGPVPSPPLTRKAERGMRFIEADDHGKAVAAILVHVFDGAVHEESRFHGLGGQTMILTPRIEPDGGRVDEGPPFLAMVAPLRRMLLEVG